MKARNDEQKPFVRQHSPGFLSLFEAGFSALRKPGATGGRSVNPARRGWIVRRRAFSVAQEFCLRVVFPVLGRQVPALPSEGTGFADLQLCNRFIQNELSALTPADFSRSTVRNVKHEAGQAHVSLPLGECVNLFGIPNFFFRLSTGYTIFRGHGYELGKRDFDGYHSYDKGFSYKRI